MGILATPGVSTVGPGADESPILTMIWVGAASPMGPTQPPTSVTAVNISPGPGWDWTYFIDDQTRSSAGATQAGGKAGT